MDQSRAPLLEGLADYHRLDRYGYTRRVTVREGGVDLRVLEVMGSEPFRADVPVSAGLADRSSSHDYRKEAEPLMADAVGAADQQ